MGSIFNTIFDSSKEPSERRQQDIWRRDADYQFRQWLKTTMPSNSLVVCSDLYDGYCQWCVDNGLQEVNITVFGRWLKKHKPRIVHVRRRIDGRLTWVYQGIKVKGA